MHDLFRFLVPSGSHVISSTIWLISIISLCVLSVLMSFMISRQENNKIRANLYLLISFLRQVAVKPVLALFSIYILYLIINIGLFYFPDLQSIVTQENLLTMLNIGEYVIFFWIIFNVVKFGQDHIIEWANKYKHTTVNIILPTISSSLYILLFLAMINTLLPVLDLTPTHQFILNKLIKAFLIGLFGWMIFQIVNTMEKFITKQYIVNNVNVLNARKIHTQLLILKRIIIALIFIIVLASILMLFESVKNLGTGLLTTAGILSAIGAFASQQSLSRIFSGLVIAFTQPIRIGDTIIIDNELGQVEKITLSYVVIKLWDLRRLILPTDYFMHKGLQNLTRESSDLLGTVFIYVDYTLPVDAVRTKFFEILHENPMWDKNVASFNVTEIKENCMEIRALMSAENSNKLWELRCNIREQLIHYIVEKFPECLAKFRYTQSYLPKNIEYHK